MTEWPTLSSSVRQHHHGISFHVSDEGLAWLIHQNPPALVTQLTSPAFLQSCALNLRQQLLTINVAHACVCADEGFSVYTRQFTSSWDFGETFLSYF